MKIEKLDIYKKLKHNKEILEMLICRREELLLDITTRRIKIEKEELLEILEKKIKQTQDEINKLEKELEEL